jgi:tetratricopeptide (TPR) repeat protein
LEGDTVKPILTAFAALAAFAMAIALPLVAHAQGNMSAGSSAQMGTVTMQEDATHRAAAAYNRGIREMKKAASAKEAADKTKHYREAQAQFNKSLGLQQNFDALLGLGQADLALGDNQGAMSSCTEALALKPDHADAKACADSAKAKLSAPAETKSPSP